MSKKRKQGVNNIKEDMYQYGMVEFKNKGIVLIQREMRQSDLSMHLTDRYPKDSLMTDESYHGQLSGRCNICLFLKGFKSGGLMKGLIQNIRKLFTVKQQEMR